MITARDRRTVWVGLIVIGSLIVAGRGVPAWRRSVQDARADADEQLRAAANAEGLIVHRIEMRDTLAARETRYLALSSALLPGTTPADASASLASLVSGAATTAGVKLGTVLMRPVSDTSGRRPLIRVGVHADFTADVEGLATMLLTLERGPVRLRVRELAVASTDLSGPPNRIETLHGDFVVEGLALGVWRRSGDVP